MQAAARSVYVSADMEGCASLVHWDEVRPSASSEYQRACELMTDEVNAVVEGALAGGAATVVVNDSHSQMRNLIAERLHPQALSVSGRLKRQFMLEGIVWRRFAGACFVGYHGGVGYPNAVMDHTYSPRLIFECRLNGSAVGETTLNAALAGHYGVPVILVSGDQTTVEEARRNLPWAVTVETKKSLSAYAADSISPGAARWALRRAAETATRNAAVGKPYALRPPIVMEIDTVKTSQADLLELIPGCRRAGARSVAFEHDDFPASYRSLMAAIFLGSTA